jgi:hypothetical protein
MLGWLFGWRNYNNASPPYYKEKKPYLPNTNRRSPVSIPPVYLVSDGKVTTEADKVFVDEGLKEGWLIPNGKHFRHTENGEQCVYRYLYR